MNLPLLMKQSHTKSFLLAGSMKLDAKVSAVIRTGQQKAHRKVEKLDKRQVRKQTLIFILFPFP